MTDNLLRARIDTVKLEIGSNSTFEIDVLREDLTHPSYGGNKIRKLKYHIQAFRESGKKGILTFGGAWSNHIYATAMLCRDLAIPCIGIIRGKAEKYLSETLKDSMNAGMEIHYLERMKYREITNDYGIFNIKEFEDYYVVPEGGSGKMGVRGCREILGSHTREYELICCPLGTGGTGAGLVNSLEDHQRLILFSALKGGEYLRENIDAWLESEELSNRFEITDEFCFGGFAKFNDELIQFMRRFNETNNIRLDALYTGKMFYGLSRLAIRGELDQNNRILVVHTGGIQGNRGIEFRTGEFIF